MALQYHTSIGKQAKDWAEAVENTVATADGAITTGQGKNVLGHAVLPAELAGQQHGQRRAIWLRLLLQLRREGRSR